VGEDEEEEIEELKLEEASWYCGRPVPCVPENTSKDETTCKYRPLVAVVVERQTGRTKNKLDATPTSSCEISLHPRAFPSLPPQHATVYYTVLP